MRLIFALPGNEGFAGRLAAAAGAELGVLETRRFPDGESYVRLGVDPQGRDVELVCTLTQPDMALMPLLLAADAARDLGAASVGLVAPYLAYMRQDARFRDGEAVSARTFARLLSGSFDRLITVDPHLHRIDDLAGLYGVPCAVLQAAPLMADWIAAHVARPLVVGPDAESAQWAAEVATRAGAPHVVAEKERLGDRSVRVVVPDLAAHAGRTPVLIDDIASSGRTLLAAAEGLARQGFARPVCLVVHALFAGDAYPRVAEVMAQVVSTDSVPHPSNAIGLAELAAGALG